MKTFPMSDQKIASLKAIETSSGNRVLNLKQV
jgi:hypothetical protein